jgi:hypothetical protein
MFFSIFFLFQFHGFKTYGLLCVEFAQKNQKFTSWMTQEGKKQGMTSCGSGSSHGPHNMGWTRCGVHAPNVKEGA